MHTNKTRRFPAWLCATVFIRLSYIIDKAPMNLVIRRQLGMEGGGQMITLFHQNRRIQIRRQHLGFRPDLANDRSADEYRLRRNAVDLDIGDPAIDLAAVRIALHRKIHEAERLLAWVEYFGSEKNCSRARTENRLCLAEPAQGLEQIFNVQKLQHSRALAAGNNEAVESLEIRFAADLHCSAAGAFDCFPVGVEVSLQS